MMVPTLLRWFLLLAVLGWMAPAGATAYVFPTSMPSGCTNSGGGVYNCGAISLGYGDTVTINGTKPATINVSGNLTTDTSTINAAGITSNLVLNISGTLTLGYQASIKGNVTAGRVTDGSGQATITGNLTATSGAIALGFKTIVTGNLVGPASAAITLGQEGRVGGNISGGSSVSLDFKSIVTGGITAQGPVSVGQQADVSGSISAGSGAVSVAFQGIVRGSITTTGAVTIGQSASITGSISGGSGAVDIGFAANVTGSITTTSGTINLQQSSTVSSCVKSSSSAAITLGYQSNASRVCCGISCNTACVANNSTFAMPQLCSGGATLVADYRMDETAWTGAANEVKDATGNARHAQAATASAASNTATTASGSAAFTSGAQSTCGYGLFNRSASPAATHAYVQLPNSFPAQSAGFTVLAWMRSTNPTQPGQRLIVHDDNDDGWAISLGDVGSNQLRFFSRQVSPTGSVTTAGSNGGGAANSNCGSTFCLDSAPVISANTWYYVAAVVDTGVKLIQTQIYASNGSLLASATSSYTGTWAPGSGQISLGGESINSGEGLDTNFHFAGNLDEVQVYSGALNTTEIQAQLSRVRSCPASTVASFGISGAGSASTCSPQTLTITARDASGNTLSGYTGTVSLSSSSGRGDWSVGSSPSPSGALVAGAANSGTASYTFASGDAGSVKLRLSHSLAQNLTVNVVDAGVPASSSNSAQISFSDNAFVWAEDLGSKISGSLVAVAGRNHDLQVNLVKKDPVTGACGTATDFNGTRNLKLWRTDNGGTWTAPSVVAPALSLPASRPASNNLSLSFSAGVANLSLATTDVGKYSLNLNDDSLSFASSQISGSLGDLTVRPFSIVVSGITMGSTANPNGSAATDTRFGAAGSSFSATVGAYRWAVGADSNVDGLPDTGATLAQTTAGGLAPGYAQAVTLSPASGSQTPAGGVLGTLANGSVSGFTGGTVTASNLSYSEVGSFLLNTSGVVSSYLATPGLNLNAVVFNAAGSQNARVGRFVPAGFTAAGASVTHRVNAACTPASAFTHLDENFQLGFGLTAVNAAGSTTLNYTGSFAKLDLSSAGGFNLAGISGSTPFKTSNARLTLGSSSGSWLNGVAAGITLVAQARRSSTAVDGPFPSAAFGIAPVDPDGVTMRSLDLDTDSPANGNDATRLSTIPLRYGRLRLQNGIGAANRALRLPLTAQYWSGTAFITNDLDTCTRVTSSNLSFGNLRGLALADLVMNPASVTVSPTAPASITLNAPAVARLSSVDVAIALGSSSTDASCLKTVSGWTPSVAASSGANLPALRGAWCATDSAAGASSDPSARATWGLYRGADKVLFQRENY